jgi:glycosyltransferase involved in cell wall biosynthesis
MAETVRHGFKAPKNLPMNTLENQKVWADKVVELALNPPTPEQRLAMAKDARETFDWSKIANQWIALINQHGEQPRFYPRGRMDLIRRAA